MAVARSLLKSAITLSYIKIKQKPAFVILCFQRKHSDENISNMYNFIAIAILHFFLFLGNSLSFTSLELVISAAIFVLLMVMVLAMIFACYRCRKNERSYGDSQRNHHDTHAPNDDEFERAAIQMRRLQGRQPSIPNTYASGSFPRRSGASTGGRLSSSSPYESHLFTQVGAIGAVGGGVSYGYETMVEFKKESLPPEPPPYTSPCSIPLNQEPPEYPPPPSPLPSRPKPTVLPKPKRPAPIPAPVAETVDKSDTDDDIDSSVYQDIDDYLVPESSPPITPRTPPKEEH